MSVSPAAAIALAKMNTSIDIRGILPSIHVSCLVLHRRGDRDVNVENGRYLARNIPGAKFVELRGEDHLPNAGDADAIVDQVQEFLTGIPSVKPSDRVLATVLFTDIADSTSTASQLGDEQWRTLLLRHNTLVREELSKFRGHEVKTTGDGFLATFDGPTRAIRCACAIRDSVQKLGISVRAGLHTGECELMGDDIGGVAVHITARVAGKARGKEVLVSSTVRDLVSGSGIQFSDRGMHTLKGVQGRWRLWAINS